METSILKLVKPSLDDTIYQTISDLAGNFQKIDNEAERYSDSPPISGFWKLSDRIYQSTPVSGGFVGYVNIREGQAAPEWSSIKSYTVGDLIVPTEDNGHYYECIQSGYSGVSEPSFPVTSEQTVSDINGYTVWQSSKEYSLHDLVIPSTENNRFYVCTVSGKSGSIEPTWSLTDGGTVSDGMAVWTGYHILTWKEKGVSSHFRPFGKIE